MSQNNFMDKIRTFLGLPTEPLRNDFRNPIWGSDDDDDVDELYTRQQMETLSDTQELQREFVQQMHDIFRNFGTLFGDMGSFFNEENFHSIGTMADLPESDEQPENFDSNRIREYYLKPGYHKPTFGRPKEDVNLDGKISSNEISDLLKLKEGGDRPRSPFQGFSKTIITTSITKPDGTIETRRIIKNGNGIVEDTITCTEPSKGSYNPSIGPINTTFFLSQLPSFFRSFH